MIRIRTAMVMTMPAALGATVLPAQSRPLAPIASSPELSAPQSVVFAGHRLAVLDRADDRQLLLLSRPTLAVERRFARAGKGPGELAQPLFLMRDALAGPRVWAFDAAQLLLTAWDTEATPPTTRQAMRVGELFFGGAVGLRGELYATGMEAGGRLRRVPLPGAPGAGAVLGVIPGDPTVPAAVRQHAWQGYPAVTDGGRRVVVAARHASVVELLDAASGSLQRQVVLDQRNRAPRFETGSRGGRPAMASGDDLRFGTIAVASTASCVLLLYSGRSRAEAPGVANLARQLVLFSSQLEEVGRWTLPFEAFALDVHPRSGEVAIVEADPEPRVHLFRDALMTQRCGA
jgi:hypothetical protein